MKIINKFLEYLNVFGIHNFKFYYNSGIDAFNKKDYEKAIELFKLAIQQPNSKPQVYYNLALSYQDLEDYDKAIETYNKFLKETPNDYDGIYNLALVYSEKGDKTKAIELFKECIKIKEDEDCLNTLINTFLNANEVKQAIEFAEELLNTSENGIKLYSNIAKIFEYKNSFSKDFTFIDVAIEMYDKITKKDPSNHEAYLSKSICYAKKGEWENSVLYCQKALDADSKSYEANNQMGLIYYCCNDLKKAILHYEAAVRLKPKDDFKIYSNLGYAYEKIGDTKNAIKIFDKLVKKFPQFPAKDEIKNHLRVLKTL